MLALAHALHFENVSDFRLSRNVKQGLLLLVYPCLGFFNVTVISGRPISQARSQREGGPGGLLIPRSKKDGFIQSRFSIQKGESIVLLISRIRVQLTRSSHDTHQSSYNAQFSRFVLILSSFSCLFSFVFGGWFWIQFIGRTICQDFHVFSNQQV